MSQRGGVASVAVSIFAFNQSRFLPQAIRGLQSQTAPPDQIFLVDDGSTDDSTRILTDAASQPSLGSSITVVAGDGNKGLPKRMNEVIERASSEWLVWIAADDILLPGALAALGRGMSDDVDVVFADLAVMDECGRPLGYRRPGQTWQRKAALKYLRHPGNPLQDLIRYNNFVSGCAPAIRRSALRAVGGYDPELRIEDLGMWLELAVHGSRFRYVPEEVARYRVVQGSHSRSERQSLLDTARLVRCCVNRDVVTSDDGSRLVAMRWALSVARTWGRPAVGLRSLAEASGLPLADVLRQLPRATSDPMVGSAIALTRLGPRQVSARLGRRRSG